MKNKKPYVFIGNCEQVQDPEAMGAIYLTDKEYEEYLAGKSQDLDELGNELLANTFETGFDLVPISEIGNNIFVEGNTDDEKAEYFGIIGK